jgi:hypothetical protein
MKTALNIRRLLRSNDTLGGILIEFPVGHLRYWLF